MGILIRSVDALMCDGIKNCSIYIENGEIAGIDKVPENFVAERVISGEGKLLIPGLINAHTHSYMTVFRNSADDIAFTDWLFKKILPMEDKLVPGDLYWGVLLACMEMIRTGTTSFLDMYIFVDETAQAAEDAGMRAVLSRGLTGGKDDVEGGKRRLDEALKEIAKWKGHDRISFMLAPHAPYTCDEGYLREVAACANHIGVGIHTHLAESRDEIATIAKNYGCTPAELMERAGIFKNHTAAAHCVYMTDNDIDILKRNDVSVVTNPLSNMKLGNGFAPVPRFLEKGLNVALGTDGAASSNSLNMFRAMSFLALIHKGVNESATAVSAAETLKIATENGAKALGLEKTTGKIAEGYRADVVLLNKRFPSMQPENDPVAALSYSVDGTETDMVIIDGKIVYESGQFKTIDAEKVYWNVEKICKRF